jgi:hypothetical protein
MTIKEAAALVGKSTDTVYRWKRAGLDIQNVAALLEHSARQDQNACGRSFELALVRGNGATQTTYSPLERVSPPAAIEYSEADVWIDLPAPFPVKSGRQALALLEGMKADCARRLAGCRLSVELAQEDLDRITEAERLVAITVGGYD